MFIRLNIKKMSSNKCSIHIVWFCTKILKVSSNSVVINLDFKFAEVTNKHMYKYEHSTSSN